MPTAAGIVWAAVTNGLNEGSARGLLAGAAGTLVLTAFERLEWAALGGQVPPYAPAPIGRRLAVRWFRLRRFRRRGTFFGHALRWLYGPSLGVLFSAVRPALPVNPVAAGMGLAAGILAFEAIAMPAVAATPPLRSWAKREIAFLALHTTVFGITTSVSLVSLIAKHERRSEK